MEKTSVKFLADSANAKVLGNTNAYVSDVEIDSRRVGPGFMFVCVKGPSNDGHAYMDGAYDLGCKVFLVSEEERGKAFLEGHADATLILVENTEMAFDYMAMAYFGQFNIKKIAVTGSTGKTSTRDLCYGVFANKFNTICSDKNYNTNLGIAMTAFKAAKNTEYAIFETAMDRKDELKVIASYLKPDLALITNIGTVHMEYIGSPEGMAIEKLKIASEFREDQTLILNGDSPFLNEEDIAKFAPRKCKHFYIGTGENVDLKLSDMKDLGFDGIEFSVNGIDVHLDLLGMHNAYNSCLAIGAGMYFGLSMEECIEGLKTVQMTEKRMQVFKYEYKGGDVFVLDDSYNANPDSVKSAIKTFTAMKAEKHIAVLGDMRELGSAKESAHVGIGKLAAELGIDVLATVGENGKLYKEGVESAIKANKNGVSGKIKIEIFSTPEEARDFVLSEIKGNCGVLFKGSLATRVIELAGEIKNILKEG